MKSMATRISLSIALLCVLATAASAWPAATTANVNLRKGPSTSEPILRTIHDGSPVEVNDCDDSGSWCLVTVDQITGFMSGRYLVETQTPKTWPRDYQTTIGAIIRLHRPQISEWQNFETIKALVAAEFRKNEDAEPAFGVIELSADTYVDQDADEVIAANIKATKIEFSTLDRNELSDIALRLGQSIPTEPITLSLAGVNASLASFQQFEDVEGLNAEPPPIFVSQTAALLLQTDGDAVTAPVANVPGLSFVINTNWDLFKEEATSVWYLREAKSWLTANSLTGPWRMASSLPDALSQLPDDGSWTDALAANEATPFPDGEVPRVFYASTPAELILLDGPAALETVPGTQLQWVRNTESDLFFHQTESQWYFLTSGRWFRAAALSGPWSFATPDLPDDFRKIPDDTPYYTVRSSVPGTSESNEARLLANVPQTARVEMGSISAEVSYAGEPTFEPITGTSLAYALNSDETVIQVGDKYYVVIDGIWFVGDGPEGPFVLATAVPDVIYTIPTSSPVHNVTYVRVYETEPGAVWFGYTMGYLWGYLAWDTFVYGSGWYYPPYWYTPPGRYPIYHPRHVSYGFGGYYDPARGAFGRYGYGYGPYRGIGVGARYNAKTGTYVRGARVYGPAGSRGFLSAYNPRTNTQAIARGGSNVYGSWGSAGVMKGSEWARAQGFQGNNGTAAVRWNSFTGRQGAVIRGNDVYAGRDGNVYRRKDGNWQKYDGGNWSGVQAPDRNSISRIGGTGPQQRPTVNSFNRKVEQRPEVKTQRRAEAKTQIQQRRDASTKSAPTRKVATTKQPAQTRKKAPPNVGRSYQTRQVSNKRAIQQRQVQRKPQTSRPQRATSQRPSANRSVRRQQLGGRRR